MATSNAIVSASHNIPQYFRAEKDDKFLYFMRNLCDSQIHCVLFFEGQLDIDRLAKAFRLSLDAEPILGCRFDHNRWSPRWERLADLDEAAVCECFPLVENDLESKITEYLTMPFAPHIGPQVRIRVLRSKNDTLCVKMNHMVADAGGLKEYLYLLAEIYRQLAATPDYTPHINIDGSRTLSQISSQINLTDKIKAIIRGAAELKSDLFPRTNWTMPYTMIPNSGATFTTFHLGPHQFQRIKNIGQKYHATVNDVLFTAFFYAFSALLQPPQHVPLRLGSTVDLRRYLKSGKGEAICNLSGFFYLTIRKHHKMSFERILSDVHSKMAWFKNNVIGVGWNSTDIFRINIIPFSLLQKMYIKFMMVMNFIGPKNVAPWVTNMGNIDHKKLVFDELTVTNAFLTAPVAYPPLFIAGISGFNNNLTISFGYNQSAFKKETIGTLIEIMQSEL